MKTVLLTGASGFLGGNFCKIYADEFKIYAAYLNHPIQLPNISSVKIDLTNAAEIKDIFEKLTFNYVIHLAASSDPNFCELNIKEAYANNVEASRNLSHICKSQKIPLLFASTDLVFDGENAPYKETDPLQPIMKYGRQKAEAEQIVREANPAKNIICRLPLLYGNSFNSGKSFIQPILQKLENKEDVYLFTDEYRTVASAKSVCEGIKLLIENNQKGIFHLGGNERLSRYEMGEIICSIYGYDKKYLKPSLQKDVKMPALRPRDVSLDNTKMKNLGWQPGLFADELQQLKDESIFQQ